jgi:hypothetical protein
MPYFSQTNIILLGLMDDKFEGQDQDKLGNNVKGVNGAFNKKYIREPRDRDSWRA